jgi:hypothetical protein
MLITVDEFINKVEESIRYKNPINKRNTNRRNIGLIGPTLNENQCIYISLISIDNQRYTENLSNTLKLSSKRKLMIEDLYVDSEYLNEDFELDKIVDKKPKL